MAFDPSDDHVINCPSADWLTETAGQTDMAVMHMQTIFRKELDADLLGRK